jgi:hypothetical protein
MRAVPTIAMLQASARSDAPSRVQQELEAVENWSSGIASKLLHGPMAQFHAPKNQEDKRCTLPTLSTLLELDDDGKNKGKK